MAKITKKAEPAAVKTEELKTVKTETVKAEPVVEKKPVTEKVAKVAEKKPAPKKTAKAAEKKPAAKKPAAPKAAAVKVVLEYRGRQVNTEDILSAVMAKAGKAKNVEIYVKPEDGAAYYVADGKNGKVEF